MRMAFLSDPHGNHPAMQAAVNDARSRGADRIYCAGDLTGYGPYPSEVIQFVKRQGIITISGNYDRKVLKATHDPKAMEKRMKPLKWRILDWTCRHIGPKEKEYLKNLPTSHHEIIDDRVSLLMVHGSPLSDEDRIYPSITPLGLRKKLQGQKPDLLVCGHTHIPFVKRVSGILVVNPGSTGQPVDGDPRPAYALVEIKPNGHFNGRIVRFSYEADAVAKAIEASLLPHRLARDLREGDKQRALP